MVRFDFDVSAVVIALGCQPRQRYALRIVVGAGTLAVTYQGVARRFTILVKHCVVRSLDPAERVGREPDNVKVFEFSFGISIGAVCDLDFAPNGSPISIQGTTNHQVLIWNDQRISLPEPWSSPDFPFVRALPDGRALVVDTGFAAGLRPNAWILNPNGSVAANFEIGSAAVEIAALWGLIAVAYHPISAKAHGHTVQPLQKAGIAFYDLSGRFVMGLNQELAKLGVTVENVRCMTALSRSQLLFAPEKLVVKGEDVENPVVLFDCATRRPTVYTSPHPRPEAVTMVDGLLHLANVEGWEDQIITFDPETKISQHRGEFLGIFRGLEGGAFLSQLSSSDYVVIVPEAPEATQTFRDTALQHEISPVL